MPRHPYRFSKQVENLIANFRGIPENYKPEALPREKPLGETMERLQARYKIGVESLEDRIRDQWESIVGKDIAPLCRPSRIERETTLVVLVSNPILRQELEFNKQILKRNLSQVKGAKTIREIVFRAG